MHRALAITALALVSSAFADDKKPIVYAAPDESVSLAKQDLDAIKRSTTTGTQTTGALPSLQVPDVGAAAASYAPSSNESDTSTTATAKSDNWLVDGVMGQKKDALTTLTSRDDVIKTKEGERAAILKEALAGTQAGALAKPAVGENTDFGVSADTKAEVQATRFGVSKVDNPLNQFMSSWISDQDKTVLKSTLTVKDATGALPDSTGADESNLELMISGRTGPAPVPVNDLAKDTVNPFVDYLNTQSAPAPVFAPPLAPSFMPAPQAIAPQGPAPESKGAVPDYAKGLIDDQAFKQAKHF